jgi:hypothetical protein
VARGGEDADTPVRHSPPPPDPVRARRWNSPPRLRCGSTARSSAAPPGRRPNPPDGVRPPRGRAGGRRRQARPRLPRPADVKSSGRLRPGPAAVGGPSAWARRAARRSQMLSPPTIAEPMSTLMRSAAARNRSGSGLAWRTSSRVTSGVSDGRPSMSRAGRAEAAVPLVAMIHFTCAQSTSRAVPGRRAAAGRYRDGVHRPRYAPG